MTTISSVFATALVSIAAASAAFGQATLSTIDGSRVDLSAQRGKVVILAVGATWLPLSMKQAEFANVLAKRYAGKPVVVYFVATDSNTAKSKNFATDDDIRKFVGTGKVLVPVLRDPDGAFSLKTFGLDQLPSFVILDKDGRQSGGPIGGIDPKFDITLPISKVVDGLL